MGLMLAGLVATIVLAYRLQISEAGRKDCNEDLEDKNKVLEEQLAEMTNLNDLLEIEQGKYEQLKDSVDIVCPSLSQIKDKIDNPNTLSIGLNYKSTAQISMVKEYLNNLGYEIYYEKQDSNVKKSFVLYYDNTIKENAEKIASDLKNKTSLDFSAIKGLSPGSISNSDINKTIIIHINS